MKFELSPIQSQSPDQTTLNMEDVESPSGDNIQPFRRHFGNNLVFLFYKGEPLITIGPHWPLTICMTLTFVLSAYFMYILIAFKKNVYIRCGLIIVSAIQILSYLVTALMNPGMVTANQHTLEDIYNVINPRAIGHLFHCSDCDVCIRGFDHHCPWTGKCIGQGNKNVFLVFVTMIPIYIITLMIVALA
ncbi:hypothetical protein pb186bvf_006057 [Paramecium bursaria]